MEEGGEQHFVRRNSKAQRYEKAWLVLERKKVKCCSIMTVGEGKSLSR